MLTLNGSSVEFKVGDGKGHGYLVAPNKSHGGVLVLHAWWGLNDFFKSICDRLASEGYTAFAPDLHQGRVAKTQAEAKELMDIMENKNIDLTRTTVSSSLDYLLNHASVKGYKTGVVGFSMGAGWAFWLSTKMPTETSAVVAFYGTWPMDFSNSKASYLGHFAPDDEWEPIDNVHSFEEKLRQAGRPVKFHFYPGAKHWFFEEDRPEYDPQAARLAWTRSLEFLHGIL
jgi:carboxymethylenebutenolidase